MSKKNFSNKNPRKQAPREVLGKGSKVSHIYDNSANGTVVDHDTDNDGNYLSNLMLVKWEGEKNLLPSIADELVSLTSKPPKQQGRRNSNQGRDNDYDSDSGYN